jgi:hypothetical protein
VPPKIEAKAKGIKTFEGAKPDNLAKPMVGLSINAVMVVLFINADVKEANSIMMMVSSVGDCFLTLITLEMKVSITPVFFKAPTITKIEANMMIKSLEKPSKASSGVKIPNKDKEINKKIVTTSTDTISVANNTMASKSNPKTRAISINLLNFQ